MWTNNRILANPATVNILHWGTMMTVHDDYLKRIPDEFYRDYACVHRSMTMHDRKTGWLNPILIT